VILIGSGEAADAKGRLLERAGAVVVGEDAEAALAIVVDDDGAVARLKARGVLVNAVDRPELCDFTLPAIVDRSPVIVAVGTGGASAGLAAALRQRIEAWLPTTVGSLAEALHGARTMMRERFPEAGNRRRALGAALAEGGSLDPFRPASVDQLAPAIEDGWVPEQARSYGGEVVSVLITSLDPDDLTLHAARALAQADRVYHSADVPAAVLDRARADAERIATPPPPEPLPGLNVVVEMAA
jgi:uroporphyrin-III C-methyltransferase/precorrin-2 dehydrogenase/sirohydrochlorin ferrochelatase